MRGLCRQGLAPQLQPPPLVRNVSPVLSDHCSLLDYYVKFPDFKILITDSNEGAGGRLRAKSNTSEIWIPLPSRKGQ